MTCRVDEPVRIVVVGAGRMGRVHLRALEASPMIEVAGVIDPSPPARAAAAAHGRATYATAQEFLAGDHADGVLIAAPSDQHPALVATFAEAGMPVLCEKPVGLGSNDALEATNAAVANGIILQVGYWRRFVPELRRLRERISAGELGEINHIACMQWDAKPPDPAFRAHSGGIAVDMGVHEFDQVSWLLDQEIRWLAALPAGGSAPPARPSDPDAATILAQMSGGATATISLGRRFPHADSCWAEVWGTRGYERIPFMWDAPGEQVFLSAMSAQADAFARAIRTGVVEAAGGQEAIAALVVAERVTALLAEASGPVGAAAQLSRSLGARP